MGLAFFPFGGYNGTLWRVGNYCLQPVAEYNMLFTPELVSLPFDWNTLLFGAGLAGAAGLATVFSHAPQEGHESPEGIDLEALKNRVAELESISARSLEQNEELAAMYAIWATVLGGEGEELEEISALFGKAEALLKTMLSQGDDTETRRQLAGLSLAWGIALNEYDELELAVDRYQKAIDVLKPLDDSGDGEAKYETAGIKLNLGIVYRELGEYEKARTTLDEAFLAYRAVEKIGVIFDTRFYMAKVSIQQGNLLYEMGETLDKVVDAYNRAMRMYVEVIEDEGRTELERDLANVLMDRCMVTYEDCMDQKFDSDEARDAVIENVLLDISRGLELLEKQCNEGNEAARFDMFHGLTLHGRVLCTVAKYTEAQASLDRVINEFADLCEGEDDVFLMQMAMAYADRAVVHLGLGNQDLSRQDCQKGSELIDKLLQEADGDDEAIQELKQQFQTLVDQLG